MKIKTLLILTALFGAAFGLAYLLIPNILLDFFGVEYTDSTIMTARFFGGAIFGYGVLAWSARDAESSSTRKAIKLALFVTCLIALILSILGVMNNFFTTMGWIPIAFFALITLAFGYFRFFKKA